MNGFTKLLLFGNANKSGIPIYATEGNVIQKMEAEETTNFQDFLSHGNFLGPS